MIRFFCFLFSFSLFLSPSTKAQDLNQKAIDAYKTANYQESLLLFKELAEKNPENSAYWFNLANSEYKLEQLESAIGHYDIVISKNSSLLPAAILYKAKALKKMSRLEDAKSTLNSLDLTPLPPQLKDQILNEMTAINNILTSLQDSKLQTQAIEFYKNEKYFSALETVRQLSQRSTDSYAFEILTLIKLEKIPEAKTLLNSTQSQIQDQNEQKRLNELSALISEWEKKYKRYLLAFDLYGGHNSNPGLRPSAQSITADTQYGLFLLFGLRHNYKNDWQWSNIYSLSESRFAKYKSLNSQRHSLFLPLSKQIKSLYLSLGPIAEMQLWEGKSSLNRTGARLRINYSDEDIELGLDSEWMNQQAQRSSYAYTKGNVSRVKLFFGLFSDRSFYQLSYSYLREDTGDYEDATGSILPLAYSGHGLELRYDYALIPRKLIASTALSYIQKNYDTRSTPEQIQRKDDNYQANLKLNFTTTTTTTLYLSTEWLKNISSMDEQTNYNKNYDLNFTSMGISIDIN